MSKRDVMVRTLSLPGVRAITQKTRLWKGLLVLNYHRIGSAGGSPFDWDLWSATAEDFDAQVGYLTRHYDVVGANDIEQALEDRSGRSVMLTFDDGYLDNYELAYPILKSHGAAATFFITTRFLDKPQLAWWDEIAWMVRNSRQSQLNANRWIAEDVPFDEPDRSGAIRRLLDVYKQLDARETTAFVDYLAEATGSGRAGSDLADGLWMTWDMVREMRAGGMSIGGHTVSHPVLARLDADAQSWEIGECKRRIEKELGEPIDTFSYPVGSRDAFNEVTCHALRQHGFRWAFSYYGGYTSLKSDSLNVLRTAIERDVSLADFRAVTVLPQLFA